jgi:hypothetical protein
MSNANVVSAETIQQWLQQKLQPTAIEEELKAKGFNTEMITQFIKEFKKARYAKRRFTAFVLMGIGAVVGFVSCVLTVLNVMPHMFDLFLYGLTIIAAILVFAGLYLLFEG